MTDKDNNNVVYTDGDLWEADLIGLPGFNHPVLSIRLNRGMNIIVTNPNPIGMSKLMGSIGACVAQLSATQNEATKPNAPKTDECEKRSDTAENDKDGSQVIGIPIRLTVFDLTGSREPLQFSRGGLPQPIPAESLAKCGFRPATQAAKPGTLYHSDLELYLYPLSCGGWQPLLITGIHSTKRLRKIHTLNDLHVMMELLGHEATQCSGV